MPRTVIRRPLYLLLGFVTCSFLLMNCTVNFSPTDEQIREKYSRLPLEVNRGTVNGKSYRFYEVSKEKKTTIVLLVHGAPGSADMWEPFFSDSTLLHEADLLAVDRLGYGGSDYGEAETSIAEQAQLLHDIISYYPGREVVAIGHSYGGPIIAQLAADYPDDVALIMMLAPALDPDAEQFESLAKIAKWKLTRWFFPKLVRVAADEKLSHVEELRKLEPRLSQIVVPTIHVHGDGDWIVPFRNLDFAVSRFQTSVLDTMHMPGANHFLIEGNNAEIIKKRLLRELAIMSKGEM